MTKADLIDEVAKNSELSKKDAEAIVQAVLDSIVESLKAGGKSRAPGLRQFSASGQIFPGGSQPENR